MSAPKDKFLAHDPVTGFPTEVLAVKVGGTADAIVATGPDGLIDASLLPATDQFELVASEGITAGNWVNVHQIGVEVIAKLRKADNGSVLTQANGFVTETVTVGVATKIYFEGVNASATGAGVGKDVFLGSAGASELDPSAIAGPGKIVQYVGRSIEATKVSFEGSRPTVLAA